MTRTGGRPVGYLNAGGRGSRLSGIVPPVGRGIAKALLTVGTPPASMLDLQFALLDGQVDAIVVGAGDQELVARSARLRERATPVHVALFDDQRGTAGDLLRAVDAHPEWFAPTTLILNADTILDVDIAQVSRQHHERGDVATVVLTRDAAAPNAAAFHVGVDGSVVRIEEGDGGSAPWPASEAWRGSSTGAVLIDTAALQSLDRDLAGTSGVYEQLLPHLLTRGDPIGAFDNRDRLFLDIGTPERWRQAQTLSGLGAMVRGDA